jgi:two-component system cell cycle sensor histidine kinase PleC
VGDHLAEDIGAVRVGALAQRVPVVPPTTPCGLVVEHLWHNPAVPAVAVLDDGRPVGLAPRERLLHTFANEIQHALYARRPIDRLMSRRPLIVDASLSIDEVQVRIAESHPAALQDGFIINEGGVFAGIGTALDLMRSSAGQARRRLAAVEQAHRRAELASRSKSTFLANLSHELRTPLNAIIGFSELILAGIGGEPSAKHRDYVDSTLVSGRLLLQLISDLLDLSKAEAGRIELDEDVVDLVTIVEHACRVLRPRAAACGLAFEVELPPHPIGFRGDQRKLTQVVLNLAGNAVKYTAAGGRVAVRLRLSGRGAEITVEDDGIGIAETDLSRVFEPFMRADNAHTRSVEGTGIGLPLAKALVELHDGQLTLTSRLGEGTTATALLPAGRIVITADPDPLPLSGAA